MIDPIETIRIYNPQGNAYYSDTAQTDVEFPVTNSCERSAKLMGDDYVRLVFKLPNRVIFDTYSFVEYDGQTFFLKETYRPTPIGCLKENINGDEVVSSAYYSYDVRFVSVANMLTKSICYRHVVVKGANNEQHIWDEPEISINGTLETLYQIIIGSIQQAATRLSASHYKDMLASIAANGKFTNGAKPDGVQLTPNTKLVTFSFSGDNIANVCTSVANAYTEDGKDTEWFITEDASHSCTLHFAKCESTDTAQVLSDYEWENNGTDRLARPYLNGGLKSVEYAQAWSDVPQVIVPYGADRNMSGISVVGIDEATQMQSTFGKRLRLDPNTTYNVHDKNGENAATITTDAHGAISNPNVNTGIEVTKFYNDIYPQCHFKITKVEVKNKRQSGETVPEYTCEGIAVDARYTKEYLAQKGMFPLRIEEATTLSVRFESGFLNGREFEIANKTHKDQGSTGYSLKFTIVADGSIEDGTLIPNGNFCPREGDQFALFNMKMPAEFVSLAKQDLAQRAYEELLDLQNTRPEVKCTSEPFTFMQHTVSFGAVMQVSSELFGDKPFISRVIGYSYKLTSPSSVQFSLASAVMQGTLSEMNNAISDVTHTAGGLEQRAINLSRRGWRDANEVANMLDSITAEMMLVGNERYQFGFTSSIECVDSGNKFASLRVGYGSLQHTQEPYINYANKGLWEISGATLTKDVNGAALDPNTPYYLFAQVADNTEPARLILTTDAHKSESEDDVPYLLLGILSSEFEGRRVFSRTNGYTAIEGGTITTEQIQDAGRNLIIDFQSNPPRIIARNGAEIIGNVRFRATDNKTAEEQLRDLGFDVDTAQSTANAAQTAANQAKYMNIYSGGNLSFKYYSTNSPKNKGLLTRLPKGTYKTAITSEDNGNTESDVDYEGLQNSCLVWFKTGAGNGYDIMDILYSHRSEVLTISDWGEDVTINETADVVVYTCVKEVIQSVISGGGYPEFPADGTWTINGIQIIGLISDNVAKVNDIANEAAEMASTAQSNFDDLKVGGENLADYDTAVVDNMTKDGNLGFVQVTADTQTQLNLIIDDYHGQSGFRIYVRQTITTTGTYSFVIKLTVSADALRIKANGLKIDTASTFNFAETIKVGTTLVVTITFTNVRQGSFAWGNVMIQRGNKPTSYQPYIEHITDALRGTTDIAGGLVMTRVMMLKNENNVVTAGMSGLTGTAANKENVLLWGGGTYNDALNAVKGLSSLPILLTKLGANSNIGCLKIMEDNKTIMVSSVQQNSMNVVITSESSEYVMKNIYTGYYFHTTKYDMTNISNYQTKTLLSLKCLPNQTLTLNIDNILLMTSRSGLSNFSTFIFQTQLKEGNNTTTIPMAIGNAVLYYERVLTSGIQYVKYCRANLTFCSFEANANNNSTERYVSIVTSNVVKVLDGKTLDSNITYYIRYHSDMGSIDTADDSSMSNINAIRGLSVTNYQLYSQNTYDVQLVATNAMAIGTAVASCSFEKLSLASSGGLCIIAADGIVLQKANGRCIMNVSDKLDITLDGLPTEEPAEENHLYIKTSTNGEKTLMLSSV